LEDKNQLPSILVFYNVTVRPSKIPKKKRDFIIDCLKYFILHAGGILSQYRKDEKQHK
jgi:hypothetical protein